MKTRIQLFSIVLAFLSVIVAPQARATCQQGCGSSDNTFFGEDALINNIGSDNTAFGFDALSSNTTGGVNTAVGKFALLSNTEGSYNTASGEGALFANTTGSANVATGFSALLSNTTGSDNTATGWGALNLNTTGVGNTGYGDAALESNLRGNFNTAIGSLALTDMGTGNLNVALGYKAGANLHDGDANIDIGNRGRARDSKTIRIGEAREQTATFIAAISGATVPTGVAVIVDSSGHLGTTTSSARFKEAIKPMDTASEAILALKPVTFRYKHELDPNGIPQFGLVAEDVEKVNPDLVARDEQGKPYSVRYEAVNAMLLNEFLKQHREVQEQKATIKELKAELQATATRQQKQIESLTAGLQKVSAQLELSKPATQTVLNNH